MTTAEHREKQGCGRNAGGARTGSDHDARRNSLGSLSGSRGQLGIGAVPSPESSRPGRKTSDIGARGSLHAAIANRAGGSRPASCADGGAHWRILMVEHILPVEDMGGRALTSGIGERP
jgi:hypothetical protein